MKIENSTFGKNKLILLCIFFYSIIFFNPTVEAQPERNTEQNSAGSNSVPIAIPDAYYTFEGMPLAVEAPGLKENDYDPEGESFVVSSFTSPSNGKLTRIVTIGAFTYEPDNGFTGIDTFTYRIRDSKDNVSDYVTVTIEVVPDLNHNPISQPDFFAVNKDSTLVIDSPGLFYNDFDPDEDSFLINTITSPANGTFNFNPSAGSFNYTPDNGFTGTDSLTYQLMDERGNLSEFTKVVIQVSEQSGNIPLALEDNFTAVKNTTLNITSPGLLLNDIDPNNQTVTASNFISPANGIITNFNSDGSFSYEPNENFTGIDSFAYRVQDEENNFSEFVKVTINVVNLNHSPHPLPDFYGTRKSETLIVETPGLIKNDFDPEGDNFVIAGFTEPSNGILTSIVTNGKFIYEPDLGFVGKDEFTYNLQDDMGNRSEFITVSIFVGKGTQPQTIRYIDPANVNSADGMNLCTDPDIPCKTINHAISVADEGDTLEIAPSIYTESFTIEKTLTLHGAGQDTISGTVIQAHADSGKANSRVIFVTEGNDVSISDLIIRHGHVSGGGESGRGGGIRVLGSKLNLTNVTFEKNRAIYGGGIHNSDASGIYTNVTFRNNYAVRGSADNQGTGGGIYNFRSSPTINKVEFINNKADRHGGGIRNTDESSPVLNDVIFTSNLAKFGGGMFNSSGSDPELMRVEFLENKADSGGGMYNSNSSPKLENVIFSSDSAVYGGGIFNTSGSNPFLFDVAFNRNYAVGFGGGIYNQLNSSPLLTVIEFNENASAFGGGLFNSSSSPLLVNVIFNKNIAFSGGGLFNLTSSPQIVNGLFRLNTAYFGGGIMNSDSSSPELMNVSISGNSADSIGGGIYNLTSSPVLTNSIVWGNTAGNNGNEIYNNEESTISLNYSIFGNAAGDTVQGSGFKVENSISDDPLFIDAVIGDLHLRAGSPAIDAGDPDTDLSVYAINDETDSIDLDGNMRLFNERIDIGPYEFQKITSVELQKAVPDEFILHQNYPNPFNPVTSIEYKVWNNEYVSLKIYDILGREVATLVNEEKPAGNYKVKFDASGLSSGVYFYSMKAGNFTETKKMVLLR